MAHQTIIVLDFGSQYTKLIARRLRELSVYSEIWPFDTPIDLILAKQPVGLIFSGGPRSLADPGAPHADGALLEAGIPALGICYGMQWMTATLGGQVAGSTNREYGHATVRPAAAGALLDPSLPSLRVWASHGDHVTTPPAGFTVTATSDSVPIAGMENAERRLYGLLFHPEVAHTEGGLDVLRRFGTGVCGCTGDWTMRSFVDEAVAGIRAEVGDGRVVCGLSGGVDSTVVAALLHRAIGERLTCIFVDNGVLRLDEAEQVRRRFIDKLKLPLECVDAAALFVERLRGVTDPEEKRKTIGKLFIDVFEQRASELGSFDFLAQGTLYPDVIESVSVVGPSAAIKSHHNVGGLPERMRFKLIEPLRELFKDEVRELGQELGLDDELVWRQPFPGPGLAVRIVGEVTAERIDMLRLADAVVVDEIRRAGWYRRVWQSFAVLLPIRSVGVMGDERTYEHTIAVRAIESLDGMTADWARLPHDLLARMSSRIVNEVKGINRVVYDISSKPPSTIEWE